MLLSFLFSFVSEEPREENAQSRERMTPVNVLACNKVCLFLKVFFGLGFRVYVEIALSSFFIEVKGSALLHSFCAMVDFSSRNMH